jgi:pimeloyl-ACP methyl ester carboxylesterase
MGGARLAGASGVNRSALENVVEIHKDQTNMPEYTVNGVRLHVRQSGEGPVLLLVHGFPLDHSMWQGQLSGLSPSYRVIAPDLRGFGASGVTPGKVTMSAMADDLAALLQAMEIREPICLCGLSMGGYVAWQFWSRHPDRLSHLILCDTRAVADSQPVARGRLLMAQSVEETGPEPVAETMIPKLFASRTLEQQPDLVEQTRRVILGTHPAGIAAAQRGMAERPDMTDRLSQIRVPTLVLCGQQDAISPPDEMREISRALPQATFALIPDAGHMAPLEQPDEVNRAISSFLGRSRKPLR